MFDDYSTIVSEAKHASFHTKELKILTFKEMLPRLPLTLTQVKAGDTSENLSDFQNYFE